MYSQCLEHGNYLINKFKKDMSKEDLMKVRKKEKYEINVSDLMFYDL